MSFGSLPSVLGNGGGVAISVIGGTGLFADGTAAAPSISFAADSDTGFYRPASGEIAFTSNGNATFRMVSTGVAAFLTSVASPGTYLSLTNAGAVTLGAGGTNQNITLTPSGTGQTLVTGLGVTGSAGAQATGQWLEFATVGTTYSLIRSYNRTGSASMNLVLNDAGGKILLGTTTDSGALLQIGTNTTTSAGGMVFGTDTFLFRSVAGTLTLNGPLQTSFSLSDAGTVKTRLENFGSDSYLSAITGSFFFRTNGGSTALTLDASQNATFAAYVNLPSNFGYRWTSRSGIFSPSDGVITLYNNATSDFTRLQFGGTTASFPALARNGTDLWVRLANDGGWGNIAAATIVATSAAGTTGANQVAYGGTTATTVGAAGGASALPATPTGYIIVNVAGTTAKIPYYNS